MWSCLRQHMTVRWMWPARSLCLGALSHEECAARRLQGPFQTRRCTCCWVARSVQIEGQQLNCLL